ncbi:MAG: hypothetical protein IJ704_05410 [Bacilli bacterium]|nr:hypothetical protein [Bacilli bacterium]
MNNKKLGIGLFIALIALVAGVSYAYFTASFQNLGTRETSITLAELGSLKLTAEEASYSSGEQYPGDIAIQKFYVEPVTKGKGIYELDLTGVIDETIFGTDVEVSLYKSIDTTEVTVTEGELTQEGSNFSRVDALVTNGLTPVYTGSLKNGLNKLFQEEFEVVSEGSTLKIRQNTESTAYPKYTFYLVYNYKNNGNQNNQMGQTFSGTISGKIIDKLSNPALDTLESLQELNPNLVVTTSTSINPNFARIAPQESAGVTYDSDYGWGYLANGTDTYITYASDFNYDETTGVYTLVNYTTCQYSACYNDLVNKYVIMNSDYSYGSSTNEAIYESVINEVDKINTADAEGNIGVTVFIGTELNEVKQGTWAPQTSGLFELQDDYGTSYYYRGNVDNNYVKFAGYYWRIIRINGDGTIRMIYAGDASTIDALPNKLEVLANGYDDSSTQYTQIGTSAFNENFNDNAYVGYMYGTPGSDNYNDTHANTNSSTIKTYLDTWYENNIKNTANEAYIADAIFCNDRSVASAETINYANTSWGESYTTNAFGTNWTIYGTYGRQIEEIERGQGNKAILTCPNKNDAFTVSDTAKGNGALSYPIGLITIDEANIAGGAREENYDYYLTTGYWYWTLSPLSYYFSAYVREVREAGRLGSANSVGHNVGGRPVLNLKSDSLKLGSGGVNDPFRVSLS